MRLTPSSLGSLRRRSETGTWFRAVEPQFARTPLDAAHTTITPTRFNEGPFAPKAFEVLYLTHDPLTALMERRAIFGNPQSPGGILAASRGTSIIHLTIHLQYVVDLCDPVQQRRIRTTTQELTGDWRGYQQRGPHTPVPQPTGTAPTQALGYALFENTDLEGFLTTSAVLPYNPNLVIFPTKLHQGSYVEYHDPAVGPRQRIDCTYGKPPKRYRIRKAKPSGSA